ncbi:uncharacterized protein LOC117640689 [Thrips palmi]|uniref:Uncharacterized protein LOC117640689 n=1 Tax=Thrips palmi TaxID=161013 RepID=A0A6P8YHE6_THRPL|nr:uncharacterized protein LOC117640689 [Thrips palmi]
MNLLRILCQSSCDKLLLRYCSLFGKCCCGVVFECCILSVFGCCRCWCCCWRHLAVELQEEVPRDDVPLEGRGIQAAAAAAAGTAAGATWKKCFVSVNEEHQLGSLTTQD